MRLSVSAQPASNGLRCCSINSLTIELLGHDDVMTTVQVKAEYRVPTFSECDDFYREEILFQEGYLRPIVCPLKFK